MPYSINNPRKIRHFVAFQKVSSGGQDLSKHNAFNHIPSTQFDDRFWKEYPLKKQTDTPSTYKVMDDDLLRDLSKEPDPCQHFIPSSDLTKSINRSMDLPNAEELAEYNELMRFRGKPAITNRFEVVGLDKNISEVIEEFLTDWAKRIDQAGAPRCISQGDQFTQDIYLILIDRLQLDPRNEAVPHTMKRLHKELFDFVKKSFRQRIWGKMIIEDGELILEVEPGTFNMRRVESFFC